MFVLIFILGWLGRLDCPDRIYRYPDRRWWLDCYQSQAHPGRRYRIEKEFSQLVFLDVILQLLVQSLAVSFTRRVLKLMQISFYIRWQWIRKLATACSSRSTRLEASQSPLRRTTLPRRMVILVYSARQFQRLCSVIKSILFLNTVHIKAELCYLNQNYASRLGHHGVSPLRRDWGLLHRRSRCWALHWPDQDWSTLQVREVGQIQPGNFLKFLY